MKTKLIYQNNSKTIRVIPQNYWIASNDNGKLVFDSWDGMTKKLIKNPFFKLRVILFFYTKVS
jgi:hypothetical protein